MSANALGGATSNSVDPGQGPQSLWRPLATVGAFSILPFAVFLNDNRAETQLDLSFAAYPLFLFVPGLVLVLAAARFRGRVAAERAAVMFAAASFLFFTFETIRNGMESVGLPVASGEVVLAGWLVVFLLGLAAAYWISRRRLSWTYTLVVGVLLTALPTLQYLHFEATTEASEPPLASKTLPPSDPSATPPTTPDVYLFLLDGYAGADQLQELFRFDNRAFLRALERRGFDVARNARAPYTVTHVSMPATFLMEYPLTTGEVSDRDPFHEVIQGDNPVVEAFREAGYEFAFGSDFGEYTCAGIEQICIHPLDGTDPGSGPGQVSLGEREWAILRGTPLATALPRMGVDPPLGGRESPILPPEEVVEQVQSEKSDQPVFTYAHIVAPHPPYRYGSDCELLDAEDPALDEWGDIEGQGGMLYIDAIRCTNASVLRAVDDILEVTPDALILVAGDHGPGFGLPENAPGSTWTNRLLRQRFSVLSASRLPEDCGPSAGIPLTVNMFRVVLECVTGAEVRNLPAEHYVVDYRQTSEVVPIEPSRLGPESPAAP